MRGAWEQTRKEVGGGRDVVDRLGRVGLSRVMLPEPIRVVSEDEAAADLKAM
jgi:hypothetical protein